MDKIKELVRSLLPEHDLMSLSAEDIAENIASNRHNSICVNLRDDKEVFIQLPVVLQDILLLLDFNIELQMNGIIGFLENPTGAYFEETIAALFRIGATEDYEIMQQIQTMLRSAGVDTARLSDNVNQLSVYQVSNRSQTHGSDLSDLFDEINVLADGLYLYRDNTSSFFDKWFSYLEDNKESLQYYIRE